MAGEPVNAGGYERCEGAYAALVAGGHAMTDFLTLLASLAIGMIVVGTIAALFADRGEW